MTQSVIDHGSDASAALHGEVSATGDACAEGAPDSRRGGPGPRPEATQLTVTDEDRRVAWLASAAVALSLVDAAIPSPLPGVKPGLANIVTLVVLARYGWATAVWVSGLRVLAGSLLLGYFLAPGFFLSLTGSVLSLLTLGLARHLPARWFGPVSLSILAAFAHIGGQLLLARAWLIPHDGVFLLTPLFAGAALVFGTLNGLIAAKLLTEQPPEPAHV